MVGKLIGAVLKNLARKAGADLGDIVNVKSRIFAIKAEIDDRTCKECLRLDGVKIRVDSLSGSKGSVTDPRYTLPRHKNCRCRYEVSYE